MKILYVTTISLTMGFFTEHIRMLQNEGHEVELACNLDESLPEKVKSLNCQAYHVPFSRSPISGDNVSAYREFKKLLKDNQYDIIHTHTPNASVIVRLACRGLRKKGLKVLYTAHGFHFYKGAPLKNWLLYFPVEWLLSYATDVLITMNKEDYACAEKFFHAKETAYTPGVGIDVSKFAVERNNCSSMRAEIGLNEDDFVILSVGELSHRKNHAVVVRAFEKLKGTKEFEHIQYLICGQGPLESDLKKLCLDNGIADRVHFLGYRNDISDICNCSDLFAFMSRQEGLPVALMEAMGCGLLVVCSPIRGNTDLVIDGMNGFISENNPDAVAEKILAAIRNQGTQSLVNMKECARETVRRFSVENVLDAMRKIYQL